MPHNYFQDEDDNNEIDAARAAMNVMNETNLWMFAQRTLIIATEAQEIMYRKFPGMWKDFDNNAMNGTKKKD